MSHNTAESAVSEATELLRKLRSSPEGKRANLADDLLLFCYRLLDEHTIVRSTSPRFRGRSFNPLRSVVYELESRPEETLRHEEWRTLLQSLLEDIATGRIIIAKKTQA